MSIAVDWLMDKLYFTERIAKRIGVYDLRTGGDWELVYQIGTENDPNGLALDPFSKYTVLYLPHIANFDSTLEIGW